MVERVLPILNEQQQTQYVTTAAKEGELPKKSWDYRPEKGEVKEEKNNPEDQKEEFQRPGPGWGRSEGGVGKERDVGNGPNLGTHLGEP